jgi:hypothetical protein
MTPRVASFVLVCATVAAIQSHASTARAASPDKALQAGRGAPQQGDGARDDSWRLRVSGALGAGFSQGALIAGSFRVLGGFEPTPTFFWGFSYRGVRGYGSDDGYDESVDSDFVTGVLEYHPIAGSWADPYMSLDLGYGFYSYDVARSFEASVRRNGLAAGLGLGFAFRSRRIAGGPQLSFVSVPSADTFSALLDLRLDVRF